MKKYAIILAGGRGKRMKSTLPKQFLEIDGKPIIVRTIEKFRQFDESIEFIIVLPADQLGLWNQIQDSFLTNIPFTLAQGGETRSQSVRAGLDNIPDNGLVAIHDAVRPYVSVETIRDSYVSAEKYGSGVAVVELIDSIREVSDGVSRAKDRNNYRLVQTPQTFQSKKIKAAYNQITTDEFTDDASLYEAAGYDVKLVSGTYENIKITTPEDLNELL